ncbi:Highly reducing polyketide synthase azaB [Penicillium oxalicum]|uniref:Highly reducing polyketide synthase azaB n=1 Tax=Penicillium oxalicum TaxID=69781 RepID=UPI0020B7E2C9|nr:Highly reducing polyketide synthase azaB [Penicillium oxalicum]KAI2787746.1 Highly reducing polyketide synthase azaB [Penicillium oxalicum]
MIAPVNAGDTDASEPGDLGVMPIAIIGMACRFPGDASNPEKLWNLCAKGKSAWSPIPESRFHAESWYHPDKGHLGTSYVKGAHFLTEDISRFDAAFFNCTAESASTMDPEVRMQLETVYEALESAGLPLDQVAGSRTGVYAGTCFRDNHDSLMRDPDTLARFFLTGNGAAMIANRISHFFDLRGPSLMVDTGCSTTLTLLHLACQSVRAGESEMAIVGGSNVLLNPDMFIAGSNLSLLSEAGRCFAFDSRAAGYGRGDGIASIVIKPLAAALRDGDPVRAVIRNSAANQDGKTATLTSPSQDAQEELMRECYDMAGLDPRDTSYVEAHGTGTQVGDTIEAHAIGHVFGAGRSSESPLVIGSVKTNIGHTEAASGLAGVIKVVMAMEKRAIPPHMNFESPNEKISLEGLKLKIPLSLQEWPSPLLQRASINNFGYGGANAHVIVESPQSMLLPLTPSSSEMGNTPNPKKRSRVFLLSAKDPAAARSMGENLYDYVATTLENSRENEEQILDQLAFTLGQRRTRFAWTTAWSGSSLADVHARLGSARSTAERSTRAPRVGMVFTGQGAQWFAMGRELFSAYPVFYDTMHEIDACLKNMGATWSAVEELQRDAKESRINQVTFSLPLSVAIQLALVDLLRSWGIRPAGVTGHSSGEVGAAYAAGAITLAGAMAIVYTRGDLTSQFQKLLDRRGGMVAVGLGREEAEKALAEVQSGTAVIACVNSPSSVTISGDECAVEEVEAMLTARGVFARRLRVEAAYHSHHMLPLAEAYRVLLSRFLEPNTEFDSTVVYSSPTTGDRMTSAADIAHPDHWVRNMVQPVEFLNSLRNLCSGAAPARTSTSTAVDMLVEVGPHGALAGPIRQTLALPELKDAGITYASCLSRGQDAVQTIHQLICTLLQAGYPVDLEAVNFPYGRSDVQVLTNLPPYPWNHETSYWAEPRRAKNCAPEPSHPTISSAYRPRARPRPRQPGDTWCVHATSHGMVVEALRQLQTPDNPSHGYQLQDVQIRNPLILEDTAEGVDVQLSLHPCGDRVRHAQGWYEFLIQSVNQTGDLWTLHCEGLCCTPSPAQGTGWAGPPAPVNAPSFTVPASAWRILNPADTYKTLHEVGVCHGPIFQNLMSAQSAPGHSQSVFQVADSAATMPQGYQQSHVIHPITLDAVFQAVYHNLPAGGTQQRTAMIPTSIQNLYISAKLITSPGHQFRADSTLMKISGQGFESSVRVINNAGTAGTRRTSHQHRAVVLTPDDKLCYTSVWAPDFDFLRPEHLLRKAEGAHQHSFSELQAAAVVFINDALQEFENEQVVAAEHQSYWDWMKGVVDQARPTLDLAGVTAQYMAALTEDLKQGVDGRLLCRFGERLPEILSGLVPAKEILRDFLVEDQAEWSSVSEYLEPFMSSLMKLHGHKRPRATVLEIGTGNVASTRMFAKALTRNDTQLFARYDVTAPSTGLVEVASKALRDDTRAECKVLDLDTPAGDQGFTRASYDLLILSASALLAAEDVVQSLTSLRALLAPGGKCILWGPTLGDSALQTIVRLLPRWSGVINATPTWQRLLAKAGFEPSNFQLEEGLNSSGYQGEVVIATAKADTTIYSAVKVVLVSGTSPPEEWQQTLQHSLPADVVSGISVVSSLEDVDVEDKVCLILEEFVQPILENPSEEQFYDLQRVLGSSRATVWVSRGAQGDAEDPRGSLHQGLLRTLRCENILRQYVSVDLDPNAPVWSSSSATQIAWILSNMLITSSFHLPETEYAIRNSVVQISRVYGDEQEAQLVGTTKPQNPELRPWSTPGQNIRLGVATPGLLNSLVFTEDPTIEETLPDDWVEIEPRAFGLNFRDIMVALGQLDETRMGFECSGVITRVGQSAQAAGFCPGQGVYAFIIGYFATKVRIPFTSVASIPAGMDFATAASIPLVFITAYHALVDLARLQRDETVLIHSGTGGVGQAAIMLAQSIGADIFVTVGSEDKREFLMRQYGIPSSRIFSSRNPSFAQHIMSETDGKGVDVVLNSLAGPLLRETWRCVGMFGRFIEIGKRDIEQNSMVEMGPFVRSTLFASLDLITLGEQRGKEVQRIFAAINELLADGEIRPVGPITRFGIGEVEKAFRTMQTGKHMGKIVLEPRPGDQVRVLTAGPRPAELSPDDTYLLVGGVGGIGKSLCQLLVDRGARNLLVLSRNAARITPETQQWLDVLQATGARVVLESCDVTQRAQLQAVFEKYSSELPPIRGVIQAAMVLKDGIFESMTHEDYLAALKPKVQGTFNLHTLLPTDLRFFILLSSISGFGGNAGQANYAAGGSYQDALARHRAGRGLPAVSIDLGMVSSVGVVAGTQHVADHLEKLGLRAVSEQEVWALVESAIRHPIRTPETCHIVTGLPGGFVRSDSPVCWNRDARFAILEQKDFSSSGLASTSNPGAGLKERLSAVTTPAEVTTLIQSALITKLAEMFSRSPEEIDPSLPLAHFGVDSLVAVELRNWSVATVQADCSIFDVMHAVSVTGLAGQMAKKSRFVKL